MCSTKYFLLIVFLLPGLAIADDDEQLNDIYRNFFHGTVDIEKTESLYSDDVIHVGPPNAPLIRGKKPFMDSNIIPLNDFITEENLALSGKAYIVRRLIMDNIANDVGYLYMKIESADGKSSEQLQKFSWLFEKTEDTWRVVTDFDGTPAPLSVLDELEAQIVIE